LISPRVLTKVENEVNVEPVGEFELKGIRRPIMAYNVLAAIIGPRHSKSGMPRKRTFKVRVRIGSDMPRRDHR